jgi:hypothetical protein
MVKHPIPHPHSHFFFVEDVLAASMPLNDTFSFIISPSAWQYIHNFFCRYRISDLLKGLVQLSEGDNLEKKLRLTRSTRHWSMKAKATM